MARPVGSCARSPPGELVVLLPQFEDEENGQEIAVIAAACPRFLDEPAEARLKEHAAVEGNGMEQQGFDGPQELFLHPPVKVVIVTVSRHVQPAEERIDL